METPKRHGRFRSVSCCVFVSCMVQFGFPDNGCPLDGRTWVPFQFRCYHFVHGGDDLIKSYTFESAKSLCHGEELLTIESADQNEFIIEHSPAEWKGNISVWLGMFYDTNSDKMKWLNNDPVEFTNWETGTSPLDLVPMDTCGALHSNTGKWEYVSCVDEVENGVICQSHQRYVCNYPLEDYDDHGASQNNQDHLTRQVQGALLSGLVVLGVIAIVGVSAVVWFLHRKRNLGLSILTPIKYHRPFRVPETDQSCLVEAVETDSLP